MRVDGLFIAVELSDGLSSDAEVATKLAEACPVDIFAVSSTPPTRVEIVQDNLDECVLCGLCLAVAPAGLDVIKLYDEGAKLAV
jgi:NAD-dependent dihydropyrimidine dehydrogenase PreA subunit